MGQGVQKTQAKIILLGLLLGFSQLVTAPVLAASQYFSPSAGSYSAQSSFAVSVYVSSEDEPASAFSALIHFPADKLRVEAISKAGSIINLWVKEPAYSNTDGTISFEGLIPNPGYSGSGGKLLTITFQALGDDTVDLTFTEGLILANDGYGTDITTGLGTAAFALLTDDAVKAANGLAADSTFATANPTEQPSARVAGIHTALASVIDSVGIGSAGSAADGAADTDSVTSLAQIVTISVLTTLALLILVGLIFVAFFLIAFMHKHTRALVRDLAHLRARRLHRVLDSLDQDIHKHLHQLERLSRDKDLSKAAQGVVLTASHQLVELEDRIADSLKRL